MVTAADIVERVVEGETPPKLFAEHRARYAFAARLAAGGRVLDLACGTGYGSAILCAAGAAAVVGLDIDGPAVAAAEERYAAAGVSFHVGDACAPPALGTFDLIVAFEVIEHVEDPQALLTAAGRLLRPGGRLVVSTPYRYRMNADGSPLNPFHRREWRTDEFADLLRPHFHDVQLFGQGLKVKKRRLPLSRRPAHWLARLQGIRADRSDAIFPLPGPRLFGLWDWFPGYVVAVCSSR